MTRREFIQSVTPSEKTSFPEIQSATPSLAPWQPAQDNPWDVSAINHLYHRLGFGAAYPDIQAALKSSPSEIIRALLDDHHVTDLMPDPPEGWERWLIVPPYLGTVHELHQEEEDGYYTAKTDIRCQWTVLMSQPKIHLREKLTLFWHNHFVVDEEKVYHPQSLFRYFDYLRKNSWGNFKQMVSDVTILPAMLVYLSGIWSQKDALNENYAREVMELFTMGRIDKDGNENYSQDDVRHLALALTGWRFRFEAPGPNVLPPYFANYYFDFNTKTTPFGASAKVFGLNAAKQYAVSPDSLDKIEADVLELLFEMRSKQIAWFICKKIYRAFVYDNAATPEAEQVIEQMAQILLDHSWELKPVLLVLFQSEHFFDPAFRGCNIKSPYEYMCGLMRKLNLEMTMNRAGTIWWFGIDTNQWIGFPPNVKGWPGYRTWLNSATLPKRTNDFAKQLIMEKIIPGKFINPHNGSFFDPIFFIDYDVISWAKQFPSYAGDLTNFAKEIAEYLCAITPDDDTIAKIVAASGILHDYEWVALEDSIKVEPARKMIYTVVSLPHFQIC